MPIYTFICRQCRLSFEELLKWQELVAYLNVTPCPDCGSELEQDMIEFKRVVHKGSDAGYKGGHH